MSALTTVNDVKAGPSKKRRLRIASTGLERILAIVTPIVLMAIWEAAAYLGLIDVRFFPAPSKIFMKMGGLMASGELWMHTAITLQRLFLGFWLGLVPALILGVMMGLNRTLRAAFNPLVVGTYPIPKSALLPLLLLIFGLGEMSKVMMVAIGVFYPVLMNTISGVRQVASVYYDVASNYRASRWQLFRTVAVPGALPTIMTGVEIGSGLGLILIAVAEMLGAQSGLGYMIWHSWELYSVETMYVGLLVVALIGYAIHLLFAEIGRLLMPWNRTM
jgi:ABC-type nitrate/sulfonate/bicarbonate transport system permease component